jgi:multiple sugar transport system permease protein
MSNFSWRTPVGVVLTAVMLFPVYWMVNVSLTAPERMRESPPDLFPTAPTFDGYARVLNEQLPYFGTSLLVASGTVALTLALAAPAAYSLAKLRPRGRRVLGFVLLVAQMIPGIIMALGFYGMYVRLGITNTLWASPTPRSPSRSRS